MIRIARIDEPLARRVTSSTASQSIWYLPKCSCTPALRPEGSSNSPSSGSATLESSAVYDWTWVTLWRVQQVYSPRSAGWQGRALQLGETRPVTSFRLSWSEAPGWWSELRTVWGGERDGLTVNKTDVQRSALCLFAQTMAPPAPSSLPALLVPPIQTASSFQRALSAKQTVKRARSSSIVSVTEIPENYDDTLDSGALNNVHGDWVNFKGQ